MTVHAEVPVRLPIPWDRLEAFCRKWGIVESDVDVLVRYAPDATHSLFDFADRQEELAEIFGRPVDLVSRKAIERSENPFRRKAILDSARVVYSSPRATSGVSWPGLPTRTSSMETRSTAPP